jgi:hypothetical protein
MLFLLKLKCILWEDRDFVDTGVPFGSFEEVFFFGLAFQVDPERDL